MGMRLGDTERTLTADEARVLEAYVAGAGLNEAVSSVYGTKIDAHVMGLQLLSDVAFTKRVLARLHGASCTWRVLADRTKAVLLDNLAMDMPDGLSLRDQLAIRRLRGDTAATVIQALKRADSATLSDAAIAEDNSTPEELARRILTMEPDGPLV